jgi:hypothetical protein
MKMSTSTPRHVAVEIAASKEEEDFKVIQKWFSMLGRESPRGYQRRGQSVDLTPLLRVKAPLNRRSESMDLSGLLRIKAPAT